MVYCMMPIFAFEIKQLGHDILEILIYSVLPMIFPPFCTLPVIPRLLESWGIMKGNGKMNG